MRFGFGLTCGRHGYPILSIDLQMVLQVLYDNIQDRNKILTKKEVQEVDMTHDGVVVKTTDGSSYQGDILVGADGSHSTVREKMWQIADELSPGWIAHDEHSRRFRESLSFSDRLFNLLSLTGPTSDYGCISGVSNSCPGIEPGSKSSVFRKHHSNLINSGPDGRIYWSYFFKLAQRAYGNDARTFSKEDEKKILDARANDNINPTLKFRHLLNTKVSYNSV